MIMYRDPDKRKRCKTCLSSRRDKWYKIFSRKVYCQFWDDTNHKTGWCGAYQSKH